LIFGYMYYDLYSNLLAFIFSATVGSLATHTLIEVVLSRGFLKFRRSLPSYGVFVLLFAVGCLIVTTGFFGYDTRLPAESKITQVGFSTNDEDVYFFRDSSDHDLVFSDQANIADFLAMNKAWISDMQVQASKPYSLKTNRLISDYAAKAQYAPYRMTYTLSSGLKTVRTVYFNFTQEPYASLYRQIRGTAEYKQQQYKYLFKSDGVLKDLFIYDKTGQIVQFPVEYVNDECRAKVLTALRQDLLRNTAGEPGGKLLCYLNLSVLYDFEGPIGNQGYARVSQRIPLTDAFVQTKAILDEYRLLDHLDAYADQYEVAYVAKSRIGENTLLDTLKLLYSQGPYFLPDNGWTGGSVPVLDDGQSFVKIDDRALVRLLYFNGQDVDLADDDDYLLVLAMRSQILPDGSVTDTEPLPVLYLPADQIPQELADLLDR
jgi:hypothetical protein